jgi:uncharacterized damage-inducible protein DinB
MKAMLFALVTLAAPVAAAQTPSAAPAPAPAGIRGDVLAQLDDAAGKLQQLAQAIPQDKFTWRPGAGVRSVSEVLMHVGGGNYYILTFAGIKHAEGAMGGEKSVTDKAQVLEQLRRSFDFARAAIRAMPDADLDKPTTMFGQSTTYRNVILTTATHAHEHLGQLIAYARMNSVVPPWSMASGGGQ